MHKYLPTAATWCLSRESAVFLVLFLSMVSAQPGISQGRSALTAEETASKQIPVAARRIRCENRIDEIDIGLSRPCSRKELSEFLKTDTKKATIYLELGKAIRARDEKILRNFLTDLGYKNVIVERSFGMFQETPTIIKRDMISQ
jgi:hypothetical protein